MQEPIEEITAEILNRKLDLALEKLDRTLEPRSNFNLADWQRRNGVALLGAG